MRKRFIKQAACIVLAFSMTISPVTVFGAQIDIEDQVEDTEEVAEDNLINEETDTVGMEGDTAENMEQDTEKAVEESEEAKAELSEDNIENNTETEKTNTKIRPMTIMDNESNGELIDIKDTVISEIQDQTFTGKEIKPNVTVYYGDTKLVNGTDYQLIYENNCQPGKANVTVTGIGNYSGTRTISFYITPMAPSGIKVKQATQSAITLSWKKVTNATGYIIYRYNEKSKSYEKIKTITNKNTTSYKQKNLESFTTYRYKIQSYIKVSNKIYKGKLSKQVKGNTKIEKVSIRSAIASNTSVKISWDKVSKASGYMIYMSTSKNGKYEKISTESKKATSFTKEGLSSGTVYYFKVRAYINVNKSKKYGAYSKVKKSKTRTDIRLEGIESQILNQLQTAKTNQYKKSVNQIMTKAHYSALVELCECYSSDQKSDSEILKQARQLKYKNCKGAKNVALKKSNAMKFQFSGLHMNDIMATVNSQIKGKRDFIFVRVYYNAWANQTTVYIVNGGIS